MIAGCIFIPFEFDSRRITVGLVHHSSDVLEPVFCAATEQHYRSRSTNGHKLATVTKYRLREILATTAVVVHSIRTYL